MQKVWNASVVDLISLLTLQNRNAMTVAKFGIWGNVSRFVHREGRIMIDRCDSIDLHFRVTFFANVWYSVLPLNRAL